MTMQSGAAQAAATQGAYNAIGQGVQGVGNAVGYAMGGQSNQPGMPQMNWNPITGQFPN
jgi:hypothetical protein